MNDTHLVFTSAVIFFFEGFCESFDSFLLGRVYGLCRLRLQ